MVILFLNNSGPVRVHGRLSTSFSRLKRDTHRWERSRHIKIQMRLLGLKRNANCSTIGVKAVGDIECENVKAPLRSIFLS